MICSLLLLYASSQCFQQFRLEWRTFHSLLKKSMGISGNQVRGACYTYKQNYSLDVRKLSLGPYDYVVFGFRRRCLPNLPHISARESPREFRRTSGQAVFLERGDEKISDSMALFEAMCYRCPNQFHFAQVEICTRSWYQSIPNHEFEIFLYGSTSLRQLTQASGPNLQKPDMHPIPFRDDSLRH